MQLPLALGHREGTPRARGAGLGWDQQAAEQEHPTREASHQEASPRDHKLLQIAKSTPQPSLTIHSSVYSLANTSSFPIQTLTNPVLKHNRFYTNASVSGKAAVVNMQYTQLTVKNLHVAQKQ